MTRGWEAAICGLALTVAGCATTGTQTAATPAPAIAPPTVDAPEIGRIPEGALPAGECGMLLWTVEAEQPALIFRSVVGEGALMTIDGAPIELALTSAAGDARFGVSANEAFLGAAGVVVEVGVTFGLAFDGGSYVEKGRLIVRGADGWERVAPVAGLAGCRAGG